MASAQVLAGRMAALLCTHEPGWRLPRLSALARRFDVSLAEVEAVIAELSARHLLRRLPDGQIYRASPLDYLVSLENLPGIATRIDPMNAQMVCEEQTIKWRRIPEEIGWVIGVDPGASVCVLRHMWRANGDRAALATTYVPERLAASLPAPFDSAPAFQPPSAGFTGGNEEPANPVLAPPGPAEEAWPQVIPLDVLRQLAPLDPHRAANAPNGARPLGDPARAGPDDLAGQVGALHIEMQLPPPSVGKSLRLASGQSAVIVSVRYDDPSLGTPVALTVAALRPDLFRIVITSATAPSLGGDSGRLSDATAHLAEG